MLYMLIDACDTITYLFHALVSCHLVTPPNLLKLKKKKVSS